MTQYIDKNEKTAELVKITRASVLGAAAGLAVCTVLLCLCSFLMVKAGSLPVGFLPVISAVISGIGGFAAGYFSVSMYKKRGMLLGLLTGGIMFIAVFLTGLANSDTGDIATVLIKCGIFTVTGSIGGVVRVNKRIKTTRKIS
ncbi:MAG: TIGR04086 family membrane protein [Clostridia bacterium]|nr:TIGR04086 family membrane protein [Clostridia bacterium]